MAEQYRNVSTYLSNIHYKLLTNIEDYLEDKKKNKQNATLTYECPNKHIKTLSIGSFNNKKTKIKESYELCADCLKIEKNKHSMNELQESIKHLGHTVLSFTDTHNISYQCGNCNNIVPHTEKRNLLRGTKFCIKCQNDKFKLDYDDVKSRVEKCGFKLLLKEKEYENNKQLLPMICPCGAECNVKLFDVERGRKCISCKTARSEDTNIERYGCRNVMHNAEIFNRTIENAFRWKEYTFPSGKVIKYQGYENYAIDMLLESHNEDDILTTAEDCPIIFYEYNGSEHRYFLDIYVKSENMIIEVKSTWTYTLDTPKIYAKKEACIRQGYGCEIWIISEKGELETIVM